MAIHNDSAPISMSEIFAEFHPGGTFAGSNTSLISHYRGGSFVNSANSNVPTSGAIGIKSFYGAIRKFVGSFTLTKAEYDTTYPTINSYNSNTLISIYLTGKGWDGRAPVDVTITIPSGQTIGPLIIDAAFTNDSNIVINNRGTIMGMGGSGGRGSGYDLSDYNDSFETTYFGLKSWFPRIGGSSGGRRILQPQPGAPGGDAITVYRPVTIDNLGGTIIGGGGGGGGGMAAFSGTASDPAIIVGGSGGSGGQGYGTSLGGDTGPARIPGGWVPNAAGLGWPFSNSYTSFAPAGNINGPGGMPTNDIGGVGMSIPTFPYVDDYLINKYNQSVAVGGQGGQGGSLGSAGGAGHLPFKGSSVGTFGSGGRAGRPVYIISTGGSVNWINQGTLTGTSISYRGSYNITLSPGVVDNFELSGYLYVFNQIQDNNPQSINITLQPGTILDVFHTATGYSRTGSAVNYAALNINSIGNPIITITNYGTIQNTYTGPTFTDNHPFTVLLGQSTTIYNYGIITAGSNGIAVKNSNYATLAARGTIVGSLS